VSRWRPLEANVPARALAEVVRIAQQSETEEIVINRTENQIVFTLGVRCSPHV